jgi:drug/metabolite transporter (DMT)-like permease
VLLRAVAFSTFALVAFAFNSLLCRMALSSGDTTAEAFTLVRLASGAAALFILVAGTYGAKAAYRHGSWISAFFLFLYAIAFALAYRSLTAATGALILFGAVQVTIISVSLSRGSNPTYLEWLGLLIAVCGLVYLVLPGLEAPPFIGFLLMAVAGAAWGIYTLRGRGSEDAMADTAGNFLRSVPMAVVIMLPFLGAQQMTSRGFVLAVLSGAIASGIGYAAWYAALTHHTRTRAAVLQLLVPVLTAVGASIMLTERLSARVAIAATAVLGGIALTLLRLSR